jgi:hypothetical protein
LGLTVFFETRPNPSSFQLGVLANFPGTPENDAALGVAWVYINRFYFGGNYGFVLTQNLVDTILQPSNPSDWITSGPNRGNLTPGNQNLFTNTLAGPAGSRDCNGLEYSLELAAGVISASIGGANWRIGLPPIYDPVGNAVFFQRGSTFSSLFWIVSRTDGPFVTVNGQALNFFTVVGPKPSQPRPPRIPGPSPN